MYRINYNFSIDLFSIISLMHNEIHELARSFKSVD